MQALSPTLLRLLVLALWLPLGISDDNNTAAVCAQDFKTAHLLGICPRAQFFAMALGSAASVFVSVGAYTLYTSAWHVPSATFPAPTAQIWLDMAQLVRVSSLRFSLTQPGAKLCDVKHSMQARLLAVYLPCSYALKSD